MKPLIEPLPHILSWVDQEAYKTAAGFTHSITGPQAAAKVRADVLEQFPNIDLDKLRVFADERILKNGVTLVQAPTSRPPIFFDSDNLSKDDQDYLILRHLWKNKRYEVPEPVPDEVLLTPDYYEAFKAEDEIWVRKMDRLRRSQEEARFEYFSSPEREEEEDGDGDEDGNVPEEVASGADQDDGSNVV